MRTSINLYINFHYAEQNYFQSWGGLCFLSGCMKRLITLWIVQLLRTVLFQNSGPCGVQDCTGNSPSLPSPLYLSPAHDLQENGSLDIQNTEMSIAYFPVELLTQKIQMLFLIKLSEYFSVFDSKPINISSYFVKGPICQFSVEVLLAALEIQHGGLRKGQEPDICVQAPVFSCVWLQLPKPRL